MEPSSRQRPGEVEGAQRGKRGSEKAPTTEDLIARFSLSRPEDKRIFPIAFCVALVLHSLCLLINFPASKIVVDSPKAHEAIVVRRYTPPPPKQQRPRSSCTKKDTKRKILIPDPTPDYPEPIVEPRPDLPVESLPFDGDYLIGDPEPPSGYGHRYGTVGGVGRAPVLAGVGDVSNPVRIEDSYVRPQYPEMARSARVAGEVILRAVILCDGTVADAEVMRCTVPGFGFEESAVTAVEKWRYLPATQDGSPVAVYFTVVVDFDLA